MGEGRTRRGGQNIDYHNPQETLWSLSLNQLFPS